MMVYVEPALGTRQRPVVVAPALARTERAIFVMGRE